MVDDVIFINMSCARQQIVTQIYNAEKLTKKSLFLLCIIRCTESVVSLVKLPKTRKKKQLEDNKISMFVIELLLLANVTLLLIDQIHFQYNGFLFGILLMSISHILKVKLLTIFYLKL